MSLFTFREVLGDGVMTKEQVFVLNNQGYNIVFEWKGKTHAIKSSSLDTWSEEKKQKFYKETGLSLFKGRDGWVIYNPLHFDVLGSDLNFKGTTKKPDQPINLFNYNYLFSEYDGESLDLSHWDVGNVYYFSNMFHRCTSLKYLNLNEWDVSQGIDFSGMFHDCCSLKELDLSEWDVSNSKNFNSMFEGCEDLKSLNLSNWDVSKCNSFIGMFENCSSLQSLDLSSWKVGSAMSFTCMFALCESLEFLSLPEWDISNLLFSDYMFASCKKLRSLKGQSSPCFSFSRHLFSSSALSGSGNKLLPEMYPIANTAELKKLKNSAMLIDASMYAPPFSSINNYMF